MQEFFLHDGIYETFYWQYERGYKFYLADLFLSFYTFPIREFCYGA